MKKVYCKIILGLIATISVGAYAGDLTDTMEDIANTQRNMLYMQMIQTQQQRRFQERQLEILENKKAPRAPVREAGMGWVDSVLGDDWPSTKAQE